MSTEITSKSDLETFRWKDSLSEENYLLVTYRIDSLLDGEITALDIAKEQSTVALPDSRRTLPRGHGRLHGENPGDPPPRAGRSLCPSLFPQHHGLHRASNAGETPSVSKSKSPIR